MISAALPDHVANEHRLLQALSPQQRSDLAELLAALTGALQADQPSETEPSPRRAR